MDRAAAVARNIAALKGIVAALFALIGLAEGGRVERLSRPVYRAALSILLPAEAAVRRLIVVAAQGLVAKPPPSRPLPAGLLIPVTGRRVRAAFALFEPLQRLNESRRRRSGRPAAQPRIRFIDGAGDPRVPLFRRLPAAAAAPAAEPDDTVSGAPLCRRLAALQRALDDLPGQARRLARWRARRERIAGAKRLSPLRPGRPPGHRRKATREIDRVLINCQALAFDALHPGPS
jgi:hypothetical protein